MLRPEPASGGGDGLGGVPFSSSGGTKHTLGTRESIARSDTRCAHLKDWRSERHHGNH
jgi:hypothetical protein